MIFHLIIFALLNFIIYLNIDFLINKFNVYDLPDSNRKQHQNQISVFGGGIILLNLIFLLCIVIFNENKYPEFLSNNRNFFSIFIIPLLIYVIGLFDDKLLIKNNAKFLSLFCLIFLVLIIDKEIVLEKITFSWIDREILLLNFSIVFTGLCILAFMNSFNFLDGIDLLCGIYSLIIFIIFFNLTKSFFFIPFIFALILFCLLNYKKKLFLGDSGALVVAFLISIFMIKIYKLNLIYLEQVVIILLLPILDNLRVFFIRFINKQNILTPDNNHLHHLLMKKFNNFYTVVMIMSIIFIPYVISNFFSIFYILILFQIIIYYLIIIKFKRL